MGVLKVSWLQKQCRDVPSLVVFFFDLDWDEPQWEEKETECASKIQVIRLGREREALSLSLSFTHTHTHTHTPHSGLLWRVEQLRL